MNLLLTGGARDVGRVLLSKWQKVDNANRVRGRAERYDLDGNGMPVCKESKVLIGWRTRKSPNSSSGALLRL